MMRVVNLRALTLFLFGMFAMAMGPGQAWFGAHSTVNAQDNPFGGPTETVAQDDPFGASTKKVAQDDPFASSRSARGTVTRRAPAVSHDDVLSASKETAENANPKSTLLSNSTRVDDMIREKLSKPCEFDFVETGYPEFEELLEQSLNVNIVLTSSATEDALEEDETFSGKLSGITYASALRILLAEKNATYCVQGGVIKIISLDEEYDERWCVRRMIDASETLQLIRVAEKDRIGKPVPNQIGAYVQPHSGSGGVFAIQLGGSKPAKPAAETNEIQQLAEAILQAVKDAKPKVQNPVELVTAESILIDAIDPNQEIRQCGASLTCVGGVLIVNASEATNDKVESFVEDLKFVSEATAVRR